MKNRQTKQIRILLTSASDLMSCMEVLVKVSWRADLEDSSREKSGRGFRSPSAIRTALGGAFSALNNKIKSSNESTEIQ